MSDPAAVQPSLDGRRDRAVDVLVIGSGPAGLAAAEGLAAAGVGRIEVLERERATGGIPRHSHHQGYGLRDLHRPMTGPAYARRLSASAASAGATLRTGTCVTGWAGRCVVDVTAPTGLERVHARAVLLATGARERPRSARLVPGTRPAGVLTTGQLQQMVYVHGQPVGRTAVIVGAEHVSFSAALTLRHAGVRVVAMVTGSRRAETFRAFRIGAGLGLRFPVLTGCSVESIAGHGRVEAVAVADRDGRSRWIACDTVVFTGDWVPDNELARAAGLPLDPGTRGPVVDAGARTQIPGLFAAGNLVHPVQTADLVALDGQHAAAAIAAWLLEPVPARGAPLQPGAGVVWTSPQRLHPLDSPARGRIALLPDGFFRVPKVQVRQDGRVLWTGRLPYAAPTRPTSVPSSWRRDVDPDGGPVRVECGP